jgi:hypothetical protein
MSSKQPTINNKDTPVTVKFKGSEATSQELGTEADQILDNMVELHKSGL